MRSTWIAVPVVAGVALAFALGWWSRAGVVEPQASTQRRPGADGTPNAVAASAGSDLQGVFTKGDGVAGTGTGQWRGFRGNNGTGIVEETGLKKDLRRVKTLWSVPLGEGYAGPIVWAGRAYILDYDQENHMDALRCLSTDTGKELWRRSYKVTVKRFHGMSRTVPALAEAGDKKIVVSLGPKCQVLAVDAQTGDYLWGKDLVQEYGTKVPEWYAGQCPFVEPAAARGASDKNDRVLLAPAGKEILLTAVDAATGKEIWSTPNQWGWAMTHVSILPMTFGGKRMYVYCGSGGVAGVDATNGHVLWDSDAWVIKNATVATPVDLGEGRLLFAGGYAAGAMIGQLVAKGDTFELQVLKRLPETEFGAEQQTPVFYDGLIYGAIPNGGEIVCMDRDGVKKWRTSGANKWGLGPYIVADGVIWALDDVGNLTTLATGGGEVQVIGKAKLMDKARECWGPLALVDGRLYLRDLTRMVCVEVK